MPPRDQQSLNYYDFLGVHSTATADEIKRAYQKLAKVYHPDKNPGHIQEAEEKFKYLGEAYATLSDPSKRQFYNQSLKLNQPQVATHVNFSAGTDYATHTNFAKDKYFYKRYAKNSYANHADTFFKTYEFNFDHYQADFQMKNIWTHKIGVVLTDNNIVINTLGHPPGVPEGIKDDVCVVDAAEKIIRRVAIPDIQIDHMCLLKNGNIAIGNYCKEKIYIFNPEVGNPEDHVVNLKNPTRGLVNKENLLYIADNNNQGILLYDTLSREWINKIEPKLIEIKIALSSEHLIVAGMIGFFDCREACRIYNNDLSLLKSFLVNCMGINKVIPVSNDRVAIVDNQSHIYIHNVKTGELIIDFKAKGANVIWSALTLDRKLILCDSHGLIQAYNYDTGNLIHSFKTDAPTWSADFLRLNYLRLTKKLDERFTEEQETFHPQRFGNRL